ncbi:MAG: hypothetical protein JKY19_07215, partial [Alcanivoracaceae bacterium]|nr:hypothetical protein [Alcanivoracaceae bacterium]
MFHNGEHAPNSISLTGAVPSGTGAYIPHNGIFDSTDSKFSSDYHSDIDYGDDYGVLRSDLPYFFNFYSDIRIEYAYPRTVNVVGYPSNFIGMQKGTVSGSIDPFFPCVGRNRTVNYEFNLGQAVGGMSGGPIFNADNTFSIGIHNNSSCILNGKVQSGGVPFDDDNTVKISNWLWSPTGRIHIQYPVPNIDINLVAIQSFDANFSPFNQMNIHGEIEEKNGNFNPSIRWESSINGVIGTGGEVSADVLKSKLTSGNHRITAIIDSNSESGEKNVNINVIRPIGQFTSPNRCITNIANPTTCSFNLSWSVTDTPEVSVVLNETLNSDFATGN